MSIGRKIREILDVGACTLLAVIPFEINGVEGEVSFSGDTLRYSIEDKMGEYVLPEEIISSSPIWQNVEGPYEDALYSMGLMSEEDKGKADMMVAVEGGEAFVLPWRRDNLAAPELYTDYCRDIINTWKEFTGN